MMESMTASPVARRTGDPEITPHLVTEHGLTPEEYELILEILGREPTFTELGVFSAMWSEHCGYKNSRPLLATLPTKSDAVVQGPGENAGVIDVGEGRGVAFLIVSISAHSTHHDRGTYLTGAYAASVIMGTVLVSPPSGAKQFSTLLMRRILSSM